MYPTGNNSDETHSVGLVWECRPVVKQKSIPRKIVANKHEGLVTKDLVFTAITETVLDSFGASVAVIVWAVWAFG